MIETADETKNPWDKRIDDSRLNDEVITYRIYCCGEVTEVIYFNRFNVPDKLKITTVHGSGRNHESLVDFMIKDLRNEELIDIGPNGLEVKNATELKIWCVFDRDYVPGKNDEQSYFKGLAYHKNGPINIAWSNDSFEVWLLLHFRYFDDLWNRQQLYLALDKECQGVLYQDYRKGREDTRRFVSQILKFTDIAISNAKRLYAHHRGKEEARKNPATRVFELVEEIRAILGSDFPVL